MPREELGELRARLRSLIADPSGAAAVFTDDDLDRALEEVGSRIAYDVLEGEPIYAPDGSTTIRTVHSRPFFDQDVKVYDSTYAEVTLEASSSPVRGRFVSTTDLKEPIYVVGDRYDLYAAAARLLRQWATKLKLEFDVSVSGDAFERSQKVSNLLLMADEYEAQSESGGQAGGDVGSALQERDDWSGVHYGRT